MTKLLDGVGKVCATFMNVLCGAEDLLGYHTDVC